MIVENPINRFQFQDHHLTNEEIRSALRESLPKRREILERPGMLTIDQLREKTGWNAEKFLKKISARQVLELRIQFEQPFYPDWQFHDEVQPYIAQLFDALEVQSPWSLYVWMLAVHPHMEGLTPLEVMLTGDRKRVIRIAQGRYHISQDCKEAL